jgi:hypothetical protein
MDGLGMKEVAAGSEEWVEALRAAGLLGPPCMVMSLCRVSVASLDTTAHAEQKVRLGDTCQSLGLLCYSPGTLVKDLDAVLTREPSWSQDSISVRLIIAQRGSRARGARASLWLATFVLKVCGVSAPP